MTIIISFVVGLVSFLAGRRYERRRIKYIVKPLNMQDALGVFKK